MSHPFPVLSFRPGQAYRACIGHYIYKIHIVSVIDEGYGEQIVYRYFGKHKQWWHYGMDNPMSLSLYVAQAEKEKTKSIKEPS